MAGRLFHVRHEAGIARFEPGRPEAGYWISRTSVRQVGCKVVTDGPVAVVDSGAEAPVLQDLWPLCDAAATSTLESSIIHKDAARPRKS